MAMIVCGLDECGRGALAGPLIASAAIIKTSIEDLISLLPAPLRDSKKLTKIQRQKIYDLRKDLPIEFAIESISVNEINDKGIGWANKFIFEKLFDKISADKYVVDGGIKFSNINVESVVKADGLYPEVMLASILGKVFRDLLMEDLAHKFPGYGWESNAGYGSEEHISALRQFGRCECHRTMYVDTVLDKYNK